MNFGKDRRRKHSVCGDHPLNLAEGDDVQPGTSRRQRTFHGKQHNSRDRDFFAPDQIEEWVLPEYRSLFHHLFLKEEDEIESQSSGPLNTQDNSNAITSSKAITTSLHARRRKISPSGSTASSAAAEDDGPLCNLVKSLPTWFKKMFNISDNENQQGPEDRHAWLDEIPIEICDKLRHIHIYV